MASRSQRYSTRRALFSSVFICLASVVLLLGWLHQPNSDGPTRHFAPETHVLPPDFKGQVGSGGDMGSTASPTVRLRQGTYVGEVLAKGRRLPRAVDVFRGVPYAQSTAGGNRFREAVPPPASERTVVATKFGPACPPTVPDAEVDVGEDCLSLNVYRPSGEREGKDGRLLPVVVYVHGGAFNMGRGYDRNLAFFVAHAEAPIIAISFNYRLGALGFLPSALTRREGALNLGLRDQRALFEWVRENVGAFGGDTGDVTAMGISAGAHSIGHHIMSAPSPPLFHKAIIESGAATSRAVLNASHPRHEVQFREFLIAAGVAHVPESEMMDALRDLPVEVITDAAAEVWIEYLPSMRWPFQPAIDGPASPDTSAASIMIPDMPSRSWESGRGARIPVITGFNTNEGSGFVPIDAQTDADFRRFFRVLIPALSDADLDTLSALYPDPATNSSSPYTEPPPHPSFGRQWRRLEAAYAHYAYICPVLQTAHHLSLAKQPVHVYEYAALSAPYNTANHVDEAVPVTRDTDALAHWPGLLAVSAAMHGLFTRFAASPTGDPNAPPGSSSSPSDATSAPLPEWPRFLSPFDPAVPKAEAGKILVFGRGNTERTASRSPQRGVVAEVRQLSDLELDKCRFWWDRAELSQGLGVVPGKKADVEKGGFA